MKEIWEVQKPLDRVIHTMGWPLKFATKYREFGGSFIYPMGEDKVSLGFVVGLDYKDARFSVHDALKELKTHPMVAEIIEGGKRVGWGAKTLPSGGYWAQPKQLWAPGMAHRGRRRRHGQRAEAEGRPLAMHAGMYAAEAIYERLKTAAARPTISPTTRTTSRTASSRRTCYRSRNMRQPFAKGFFMGGAIASAMTISRRPLPGRALGTRTTTPRCRVFIGPERDYPKPDGKLTFDKLGPSSPPATPPATTRRTTSASRRRCRSRWR